MIGENWFVEHVRGIQYGYPIFGCKGVHNSFFLHTLVEFSNFCESFISMCNSSLSALHYPFAHILSPSVSLHHLYNYRIYMEVGTLKCAFNEVMHTQSQFQ